MLTFSCKEWRGMGGGRVAYYRSVLCQCGGGFDVPAAAKKEGGSDELA